MMPSLSRAQLGKNEDRGPWSREKEGFSGALAKIHYSNNQEISADAIDGININTQKNVLSNALIKSTTNVKSFNTLLGSPLTS